VAFLKLKSKQFSLWCENLKIAPIQLKTILTDSALGVTNKKSSGSFERRNFGVGKWRDGEEV